jgi:hypothetical protein
MKLLSLLCLGLFCFQLNSMKLIENSENDMCDKLIQAKNYYDEIYYIDKTNQSLYEKLYLFYDEASIDKEIEMQINDIRDKRSLTIAQLNTLRNIHIRDEELKKHSHLFEQFEQFVKECHILLLAWNYPWSFKDGKIKKKQD